MNKTFYSNGKLLLTGEYAVLDGATALAIPTRYGQSLKVETTEKAGLHWKSFDEKDMIWFEEVFDLENLKGKNFQNPVSIALSKILREAQKLNPKFLSDTPGIKVQTKLNFPRDWGLGSSSTLINNLAQWAKVDAFTLLYKSFGGSGYDIAAAQYDLPLLFELQKGKPRIEEIHLPWKFTEYLFFVHLNKKQDSKEGIARYKKRKIDATVIQQISEISVSLSLCKSLSEFESLLNQHEVLISEAVGLYTIKEKLFNDYPHSIKSLGAWGGDFVLVTGNWNDMEYFKSKGYSTILPFAKMIKSNP